MNLMLRVTNEVLCQIIKYLAKASLQIFQRFDLSNVLVKILLVQL